MIVVNAAPCSRGIIIVIGSTLLVSFPDAFFSIGRIDSVDIDNPADGSVLQLEIAFHPIVDDEDVIDMARGYSFILNLTK